MYTKKILLAQLILLRIQGSKVTKNYKSHKNATTKSTFPICKVKNLPSVDILHCPEVQADIGPSEKTLIFLPPCIYLPF